MDLQEIAIKLSEHNQEGASFEAIILNGEQAVLQVVVEGFDELPIYVTMTEEQILCMCYLLNSNELIEDKKSEFNDLLLRLNVAMPLSAFAMVEERYAIFGSLSSSSSFEDIAHELVVLADNAVDALESFEEFLN
ncbi:MAG: DUF2170 family protein [Pseudomonadota bacterium]